MQTLKVLPFSDAGPNEYAPTPSQAHYLNVRQDPHDGDGTILVTAAGREVFGLDVSGIPDGSRIVKVTIRSVQKQSTAGPNTYRVGFVIGATDYFVIPSHALGTGSQYIDFDDDVLVDPSDGEAWTKDRLSRSFLVHEQLSQTPGLPRPRLTECIVLALIIPPPDRPRTRAQTGSPNADVASGSPGGRAASRAPAAAASSRAPRATARSSAPAGVTTSTSPTGRSSSRAPAAVPTAAEIARLKARVSSIAPRAVTSSPAPTATVSSPTPAGEEA